MINYTPIQILFSIGRFNVYSWGLMFAIAFLTAFFFMLYEFKKKKIPSIHAYNIGLLTLIGAIIGPRIFYIFENLVYFFHNPLEIFQIWNGGMTSYGGIIFALLFVWLYTRKNVELKFFELLDLVAPYIALAFAIGRIGCFLNWDDFGIISNIPWAISVNGELGRHPTQIYLIIADLIIFFVLLRIKKAKDVIWKTSKFKKNSYKDITLIHEADFIDKNGALFFLFTLMYSFQRFFIDFLRDYTSIYFGLAISQWMCIILFVLSVYCIANIDKIQKKEFGF